MFKDDQNFYKHIKSESENFDNISKNKNINFTKLFRQKLKNEEKIQQDLANIKIKKDKKMKKKIIRKY